MKTRADKNDTKMSSQVFKNEKMFFLKQFSLSLSNFVLALERKLVAWPQGGLGLKCPDGMITFHSPSPGALAGAVILPMTINTMWVDR